MVASLVWLTGLLALLAAQLRLAPLLAPGERGALSAGLGLGAVALTFAVYPSDPRSWSLAQSALYLTWPKPQLPYFLGNLFLGGALFSLAALAVYWANRR